MLTSRPILEIKKLKSQNTDKQRLYFGREANNTKHRFVSPNTDLATEIDRPKVSCKSLGWPQKGEKWLRNIPAQFNGKGKNKDLQKKQKPTFPDGRESTWHS